MTIVKDVELFLSISAHKLKTERPFVAGIANVATQEAQQSTLMCQ